MPVRTMIRAWSDGDGVGRGGDNPGRRLVPGLSGRFLEHEVLDLLFIILLLLQIEHRPEDMIPDGAADAETFAFILVMMQVMIAPEGLHPFERGIPGVDSIVHAAIEQITQEETGEEHK